MGIKMVFILILVAIFLCWLLIRREKFSQVDFYNHLDEYGARTDGPWASYNSADGKFLNHTFRHRIDFLDYDFDRDDYMELWGYRGAGDPKIESRGGWQGNPTNLYNNPNWDLVALYYAGRGFVNLDAHEKAPNIIDLPPRGRIEPRGSYDAYHIVLIF